MHLGSKSGAAKKGEVGLPIPEREGLGAALRTAFGGLDRTVSEDLERRLARIDAHPADRKQRD